MRTMITFLLVLIGGMVYSQDHAGLIFSEYIEGSSDNKFLEICNTGEQPVDLSDYQLKLFANGSVEPNNTNTLSGILQPGEVMVVGNSNATLFSGNFVFATACNFNGDDAIALFQISTGTMVDLIGRIGEDPGVEWKSGEKSTLNKTLVRKTGILSGVTTNPDFGFPTLADQWDVFENDNSSHLGRHIRGIPAITYEKYTLADLTYCDGYLVVGSEQDIVQVSLFTIGGVLIDNIQMSDFTDGDDDKKDILIPGKKIATGVYLIVVTFDDQTKVARKILVE